MNKDTKHTPGCFNEAYEVCLDYRKPDGFWVHSHKEHVEVKTKHGVDEKGQHDKAEAIAKARFPGCRINSVIYC